MIRVSILKLRLSANEKALSDALWRCRTLYNAALEERLGAWRLRRKSLSFYDQCRELTEVRAADPAYAELDSTMTRLTVLRRLDLAFKAFFRRCKAGERAGFPRFKGRERFDTLVFGTSGWKLSCGKLRLTGIGTFRVAGKLHRGGTPRGLRLVRKADRWYAQVLIDVGASPAVQPSHNGVGIDVGIRTFAALSDGSSVEHPHFLKKSLDELAEAQRKLASKHRGSERRRKAKLKLARLHARIANRRRDFIWQTAAELDKRYDGFAIEDLDIAEMATKKENDGRTARGLRRGIMDSAWGMFGHALACKAEEAGKPLVRVNPKGTSQRCSGCGSLVRKALRDRVHDCAACGLRMDRDLNAALNIYDLGWRSAASAAENSHGR